MSTSNYSNKNNDTYTKQKLGFVYTTRTKTSKNLKTATSKKTKKYTDKSRSITFFIFMSTSNYSNKNNDIYTKQKLGFVYTYYN